VKTLRWDAVEREATVAGSTPSTTAPLRSGDTVYEAHALVVGAVLLVSIRGCDVISVFDLGGDGTPTLRASFDSGGTFPRYFAITGEKLVVGNETSHAASVFDLADVLGIESESEPGAIAELPHASFAIPSPACVAFG
jgi:6-phosphogluconolactonase (cycloisomerase 2 family)